MSARDMMIILGFWIMFNVDILHYGSCVLIIDNKIWFYYHTMNPEIELDTFEEIYKNN